MQKVGIITVTYNSGNVIDEFIASALHQTHSNLSLYIVDNASKDDTVERLRSYRDGRVKIIESATNTGAADGNNQGIRTALADDCDPILLINNDTVFEADLLEKLLAGMNGHGCEMIAPKILFHGQANVIWSAGGDFDRARGYTSHLYGHGECDSGQYDRCRYVENAPTTCLLLKRKVFEQIGYLDHRYFAYVEDTDFCYRAKCAGMKLLYFPSAVIWHKAHSLSGGLFSEFMMRYTTRNRVYFMLKHLGLLRSLYFIPAYQVYLIQQFVFRKIDMSMFWVREKGFLEGLQVWRESLNDASNM